MRPNRARLLLRLLQVALPAAFLACGGGPSPMALIRPDVTTISARFVAQFTPGAEIAHPTFLYREHADGEVTCPDESDVKLDGDVYMSDGWTSVRSDPASADPEAAVLASGLATDLNSPQEYVVCMVATVDEGPVFGERVEQDGDSGGSSESRRPLIFKTLPGGPPKATPSPTPVAPPPPPPATPSATPTSTPSPTATPARTATAAPKANPPAPAPPPAATPTPESPPPPPPPPPTAVPTAPPTVAPTPPPTPLATPSATPTPASTATPRPTPTEEPVEDEPQAGA